MTAERWVREMWSGAGGPLAALTRPLLWPVEILFRGVVALRNLGFDMGAITSSDPAIPAVSVGNLTVGGTGKTPMAGWIVEELIRDGARVALVARGYGRDEMLLHARWNPSAHVIASPDRVAGVRQAAEQGCELAVLDDAFQHRRIGRSLNIVLVAAETPFPGACLPRGPYREAPSALSRADLVVVTRKSAVAADAEEVVSALRQGGYVGPIARVHLHPERFERLNGDPAERPEGPVGVYTGVADPTSVQRGLESVGVSVAWIEAFPDHHEFDTTDLVQLGERAHTGPIIVTEKDAVKLESLLREEGAGRGGVPDLDIRVLCLGLRFEAGEAEVRAALQAFASSRHSR